LCNQAEILQEESYFGKPFLINASLTSQNKSFSLRPLVDSGSAAYTLIHTKLADKVCKELGLQPIPLSKEKLIRGYDGKLSKKAITHKILPNLTIGNYKEPTVPMLIADLGHHEVILGKPWINKNGILLDMRHDTIVFPNQLDSSISVLPIPYTKPLSWSGSISTPFAHTNAPKVLKRPASIAQEEAFSIYSIGVAPFQTLVDRSKSNHTEVFAMLVEDINREIVYYTRCNLDSISLFSIDETAQNLEDIKAKLPSEYQDYLDIFDRAQADKLPPPRSYDYKIELTSDATPPRCQAYRMSPYKLQKVKECLNENLSKGFITPSKAPYFLPVLFALKANGDLRFCVDYRKLNAITKRNRYLLRALQDRGTSVENEED